MYYVRLENNEEEILTEQSFFDIEEALLATNKLFNGVKHNRNTRVVLIKDEHNSIPSEELLNLSIGE